MLTVRSFFNLIIPVVCVDPVNPYVKKLESRLVALSRRNPSQSNGKCAYTALAVQTAKCKHPDLDPVERRQMVKDTIQQVNSVYKDLPASSKAQYDSLPR